MTPSSEAIVIAQRPGKKLVSGKYDKNMKADNVSDSSVSLANNTSSNNSNSKDKKKKNNHPGKINLPLDPLVVNIDRKPRKSRATTLGKATVKKNNVDTNVVKGNTEVKAPSPTQTRCVNKKEKGAAKATKTKHHSALPITSSTITKVIKTNLRRVSTSSTPNTTSKPNETSNENTKTRRGQRGTKGKGKGGARGRQQKITLSSSGDSGEDSDYYAAGTYSLAPEARSLPPPPQNWMSIDLCINGNELVVEIIRSTTPSCCGEEVAEEVEELSGELKTISNLNRPQSIVV